MKKVLFVSYLVKSVEDTLKVLGAATTDDLWYITEGDLLPVLRIKKISTFHL